MIDVVVIGAGYAGVSCALRLAARARRAGLPVRVRLVGERPVLVERIRLHQVMTGQPVRARPLAALLAGRGVELVIGRAEDIDLVARTLRVGDRRLRWDHLVLAAGSTTDQRRVPGASAHAVALEADGMAGLRQRLQALPDGARVAVVGGGLTGLELATEVAERRPALDVHLVAGAGVGEGFTPAAREHLLRTLARLRVRLHEGSRVTAVHAGELQLGGARLPFDLCLWTAGFLASPLGWDAGLRVNAAGQVLVDAALRSVSHPRVLVAGDMAAPAHDDPRRAWPMGCKTALPMGVHVAESLVDELQGRPPRAFDYALLFYCVSLGRRDGLVQWADERGVPVGRVLTGRRAAWFKELVCRSTVWALQLERRGLPGVVWKRGAASPSEGDLPWIESPAAASAATSASWPPGDRGASASATASTAASTTAHSSTPRPSSPSGR